MTALAQIAQPLYNNVALNYRFLKWRIKKMNSELDIEKGVGYKTIIRSCEYIDADEFRGSVLPAGTMMAFRLMKNYKQGKERVTTIYILLGNFDDSEEVKTQAEDVIAFNSKIDTYLNRHVFTDSSKDTHGIESVYDIEQKALNGHIIQALDLQIEVPQATIDKYDLLCGVV